MINTKKGHPTFITASANISICFKHFLFKLGAYSAALLTHVQTVCRILRFDLITRSQINIKALFTTRAKPIPSICWAESKVLNVLVNTASRTYLVTRFWRWRAQFSFSICLPTFRIGARPTPTVKAILIMGIGSKLIRCLYLFAQKTFFVCHTSTILYKETAPRTVQERVIYEAS